jgi:dephospho-CoA kinase
VLVLAGGIASGKSTVARMLERHGGWRLDLDALSREVTSAGTQVVRNIARAFGDDVVDAHGELRRAALAARAFATPESTQELESIVHPAVLDLLRSRLASAKAGQVCVVEVPLLDRVERLVAVADEVMCVTCPLEVRRERACERGMAGSDFDARVSRQPSDEYLTSCATYVIVNDGDLGRLQAQVDEWWNAHELNGWELVNGNEKYAVL